ncbi:MAG: hthA [Myxococcales bacterium]|nr:hthA [Myxococcales bacterium]
MLAPRTTPDLGCVPAVMVKLSKSDLVKLDELVAELTVVRLGSASSIGTVLTTFRVFAELESMVCMCPVERTSGWAVERFHCDNFPNDTKFRQLSIAFLERAPRRFGWYDAIRPEPEQRNVVLDLESLVSRADLEQSAVYTELLVPLHLQHTHQVRALICEGASLLAWFGTFHPVSVDTRQQELMISMIPAMRRRLSIERRLDTASMQTAALETALDQLGVPAYVIGASGRIFESNQSGKALLQTRRSDVSAALQDALAGRPSSINFELVRFREHGMGDHWLAILRARGSDIRIAQAVSLAVIRFKLTSRQREVLELVLRGEANTTIAAMLAISERAVEQHVSAMFDRAAVDSRSALISLVLLGR